MQLRRTTLRATRPFALKTTVLSHGWHECAPMSWSEGGRCLQLIERNGHGAMRVSVVEGRPSRTAATLKVTIEGAEIEDADVKRIRAHLRKSLGLDRDLTEFHALCREHPTLHVLPAIGGGRGLRSASMAENVIKAVLGTNVNWTQAVKMINRLAQIGPHVPHFRNLNAWPTPQEILRAGEKYLTEVCRVGYRAESILAFCRDVAAGHFDENDLEQMAADESIPSDDILKHLRQIRGVGPTTAHYLLSFLGRHDRLAIDSSTVAHVARTHTNGRKPTLKQIERIYARYGRWKNLVWWNELWLTWSTARRILSESRRGPAAKRRVAG